MLTYQYDNLNRMTLKVVPERAGLDPIHTRDVHYGYDLRNLQTFARFDSAAGEGVTSVHDGFGRLASSTINMGGISRDFTYQYREDGARTRLTYPDGIYLTIGYDARARPFSLDASNACCLYHVAYSAADFGPAAPPAGRADSANRRGAAIASAPCSRDGSAFSRCGRTCRS